MQIPTIHLNGTSRGALELALMNAHHAIEEAIKLLRETYPNGRDYYPQGPDAIRIATAEYAKREARLQSVSDELVEIWEAILG